jgi:DNA polymerase-3 subunit alpha (Gram-positive type)
MTPTLYVTDVETTGLDERVNEIIELSLARINDDVQKTFYIQPTNFDVIEEAALRINGHKIEDLRRGFFVDEETKETIVYQKPMKALVQIEQFLMEDCVTAMERFLVGQNVNFDRGFLLQLWARQGQAETYPFGRMYLDTMQIAIFLDYVNGIGRQSYHLGGLVKDLEIKKEKAHRAANDVRMTKDLFFKLIEMAKKLGTGVDISKLTTNEDPVRSK